MSEPRALLLDGLGTLLELRSPGAALQQALRDRQIEISPVAARSAFAAEIAYYLDHHLEGRDRDSLVDLRRRCARVLHDALPVAVRSACSRADSHAMMLDCLRFDVYPEVPQALARLRRRGLKLIVVSNWDVSLHELLRRRGLAELLDGAVSSAEVGCAKPATAIFQRALALAQVAPSQAMHVGDTPASDVDGALAAGIAPVLLVRKSTAPVQATRGVPVIRSLSELLP